MRLDYHIGNTERLLGGDPLLIERHFGSKGFADMKRLRQAVYEGVSVSVVEGGESGAALKYGNQSSASPSPTKVVEKSNGRRSSRQGGGAAQINGSSDLERSSVCVFPR